jgi:predicted TIM-barrel fold metal-dependent hydrolase
MYGELLGRFSLSPLSSFDRSCSSVGPAVEAFGFGRIIFGSAPSPVSRAQSNASDWYEIGREAFAELGVDQESVDAVFGGNAQRIYAAGSDGRA